METRLLIFFVDFLFFGAGRRLSCGGLNCNFFDPAHRGQALSRKISRSKRISDRIDIFALNLHLCRRNMFAAHPIVLCDG